MDPSITIACRLSGRRAGYGFLAAARRSVTFRYTVHTLRSLLPARRWKGQQDCPSRRKLVSLGMEEGDAGLVRWRAGCLAPSGEEEETGEDGSKAAAFLWLRYNCMPRHCCCCSSAAPPRPKGQGPRAQPSRLSVVGASNRRCLHAHLQTPGLQ